MKHLFLLLTLFYVGLLNSHAQNQKSESKLKEALQQKSEVFNVESDFKNARDFFLEKQWDSTLVYTAKQLNKVSNTTELIHFCNLLRGYSFRKKKLYQEALNEFKKIPKDFSFYNNAIVSLGEISILLKDNDNAIAYLKQVEQLPQEELIGIEKSSIDENLGICYLLKEDHTKAEFYILKSIELLEKEKDTSKLVVSYSNIANLYYQQYKDKLAIQYFKKAYAFAKNAEAFALKQDAAYNMAIVEEDLKNYKKALEYRIEYDQWTDSVNNQSKIYATAQAEKKIAVEKKEKEVAILQADNEVKAAQRNTYLYSAIVLFVMLGVSLYLFRDRVRRNKIIKQQNAELDELNATKDKLFSIVSHDLRSSVNAIKTSNKKLLNTLETDQLPKVNKLLKNNSAIVNNAYRLLDNLLNWALLQTKQTFFLTTNLRLAPIVDHVVYNYKAILADKELSFTNSVHKDAVAHVDKESLKIVLRNLIDNAIKFSNPNDAITIYTEDKDHEFCQLIVEDTGIGMSEATRLELLKDTSLLAKKQHEDIIGTGLGVQLCKSMIKKNNGTFSIESELGKGTKIIISLPKKPT